MSENLSFAQPSSSITKHFLLWRKDIPDAHLVIYVVCGSGDWQGPVTDRFALLHGVRGAGPTKRRLCSLYTFQKSHSVKAKCHIWNPLDKENMLFPPTITILTLPSSTSVLALDLLWTWQHRDHRHGSANLWFPPVTALLKAITHSGLNWKHINKLAWRWWASL